MDPMSPVVALVIIVGCLLLSAFFSGSETALLRLQPDEVEEEVRDARGPASLAIHSLLQSTSRLLVTILLGNNVVNILAAAVSSALAVAYLGERIGIAAATAILTVVVLIFCEVLPKALAARSPRQVAHTVALPLYLLHQGLRPMHALFDRFVEPVVQRVTSRRGLGPDEPATSSEEVLRLARRAREGTSRAPGTPLAIIGAAAGAADMTVSEIMMPRTEMVAFSADVPAAELLEQVIEERYTRVPIYQGDIDTILGVVHLKDLIKHVREGGQDVQAILKPVLRVPERKPILALLADMQRAFVHMAVVKDEFGVTQGLITQEDVLEEIVGEIRDEFDREELLTIRRLSDGAYQALGRIRVLDFNRESGWSVESEPGDTLSGLVYNALGHTPRKGEQVEVGRHTFTVVDMSGTRISQVRVHQKPTNGGLPGT